MSFTGFEVLLKDTRFGELSERDDWPRPLTLPPADAIRGRSLAKPEPEVAHAAACFVSRPSEGQPGQLDIVWASYLPVQLPEIPSRSLSSPYQVTLTLHGRFFVDAGRVAIDFGEGEAAEARTVRQRWNDLLRDEGTLDLVLPALESFAESLAPEERASVLRDLTSAIHASTLFTSHRPSICRRHQWVYRLGGSGASWAIVDADATACEIPEPAADEPSLAAVFPSLAGLCDDGFCLTYSGWPDLLREDQRSAWPESALLRLLDLDAAAVFADPKRLGVFVRTVEVARGVLSSEAVAKRLREIVRQGMASLKLAAVMRHRDLIQRLLALIPAGSKLKIDLGSIPLDVAGRLVEPLWEEGHSVLVTPIGSGDASPTHEETEGMLDRLLAVASIGKEDVFFEHRAWIVCQVVGWPRPDSATPWERLGMLPIFPVRVGSESVLELVGREALTEALRTDRLFVDTFGLGGPLQRALRHGPGQDLLTIARRTADAAFGPDVVPDCDPFLCMTLLESRPPLVEAERPRSELLRDLLAALGPADLESDKKALRYLLHATPESFAHDVALFYESGSEGAPIWGELASRALRQSGGAWRVVPRGLVDLLTGRQRATLGVTPLDRAGVVALLGSVGPAALDLADLTEGDVRSLIEECKPADFEVIRALPIHRTTEGRRVSIDERCRWRADFPIDGDLAENVVVLEPDRMPAVALRQKEIHPHSLDAKGVIDLILKAPSPHLRWKTVLDALSSLGVVPAHLSTALKTTRWITTSGGRAVAPQQVIESRSMNELIRDALADANVDEPDMVSVLNLPGPFLAHKVVSSLFPTLGDALDKLGQTLALDDRYGLGPLKRDEVSLDGLRSVFADAPSEVLPCFPLLRGQTGVGAIRENLDAAIEGRLVPRLLRQVPNARMTAILGYLAKRHADAPERERAGLFEWYRRYLEAASKSEQAEAILVDIPLLSQVGRWERAAGLTIAAVGVEPSCLLHPDLARILTADVHRPGNPVAISPTANGVAPGAGGDHSLDVEIQLGVHALSAYAEEWASLPAVPRELVGGLIALLGDAPEMTDLARNFLGNFQAETLLENLSWDGTAPYLLQGALRGGAGMSITRAMKMRRTLIELSDGDRTRVVNLLGRPIEVPVRQAFEDLLLPPEDLGEREGLRYVRVRLRRVNPTRLPGRLNPVSVLRETACRLLEVVDRQTIPNFHEVWGKLAQSEQFDLQIAQRCLQEGLPTVLHNLGLRHREPLAAVLRDWHDASRELAQLEANDDKRRTQAEERKRRARDRLRQLLETDAKAQNHCLEAVREEIGRSQYTPDSIPFELFQNADDAVAELRTLQGYVRPPEESSFRFVVDSDGRSLWFASWGRAINRHQAAGFDGSVRGFDQDLEKMLTLGWSDKGRADRGDEPTTGKFGLGFKSVLLATDRPRVLSGRLAFEVLGGLFPAALAEGRKAMEERLRELGPEGRDGTIVELPLNGIEPVEILRRFIELAPLLVVFGREIHSCVVRSADGRDESYRWEGMPLEGVPGVEAGELPGPGQGKVLVLTGKSSAMVLKLGPVGVRELPGHWPTFWVTAPTGEAEKVGFAVNAPFELDKGRSKLAYSSRKNGEVAASAGREMGEVLVALYRETLANWDGFSVALGLHDGASPRSFWESIWERLGNPLVGHHDPYGPLLRGMFWGGADRAMCRLVSECEALPNGLWGDDRGLTRLDRLRAVLTGLLDAEEVYLGVARWPSLRAEYPSDTLISGRVFEDLRRLAPGMVPDCDKLTLAGAIESELDEARSATPETAARLGTTIAPEFLNAQASRGVAALQEITSLLDNLSGVNFRARNGGRYPARGLLVPGSDDEGLRAAFAPDQSVLSTDYGNAALGFFRSCRNQLRADAKLLKGWAMDALDDGRRKAVLTYLLRGELGQALADQLAGQIAGTWLARLEESEVMNRGFTRNEAAVIIGRLGLFKTVAPPLPPPPPIDSRIVLEKVHEWWGGNRVDQIRRYESRWYPQGRLPGLADDITRRSPAEDRRGWMVLLMLGAMHTMGRTRAEAHRNFLDKCERNGWLDVFSRPTDDLGKWMDVLKDYLGKNVGDSPYLQWMGRFVSIFQLAHWLPAYVESFLAIERFRDAFELDEITASRTSPAFQGGGLDAPPVSRTLGIGACFVVRELVRTKVITNPRAYRHCFVPSARVRRLMSLLGCRGLEGSFVSASERVKASGMIHNYLVDTLQDDTKAVFHGDFDLPLIALTEPANRNRLSDLIGAGQADNLQEAEDEPQEVF